MQGKSSGWIQRDFQIYPWENFGLKEKGNLNLSEFCILKLNGTAGTLLKPEGTKTMQLPHDQGAFFTSATSEDVNGKLTFGVISTHIEHYAKNTEAGFYFAFENKEGFNSRTYLNEIAKSTDIVVVIGYSFPLMNHDV